MSTPLSLEKYAAINAELDARKRPRDEVLRAAGVTDEAWEKTADFWLGRMAQEAKRDRFALSQRYAALFASHRAELEKKKPSSRPESLPSMARGQIAAPIPLASPVVTNGGGAPYPAPPASFVRMSEPPPPSAPYPPPSAPASYAAPPPPPLSAPPPSSVAAPPPPSVAAPPPPSALPPVPPPPPRANLGMTPPPYATPNPNLGASRPPWAPPPSQPTPPPSNLGASRPPWAPAPPVSNPTPPPSNLGASRPPWAPAPNPPNPNLGLTPPPYTTPSPNFGVTPPPYSNPNAPNPYGSPRTAPMNPGPPPPHVATGAPAPAGPPSGYVARLSVDQLAALRAELAVAPEKEHAATRERFGLDDATWPHEEAHWQRRFAADKSLFQTYVKRFQYFRALLAPRT